MRPTDKTRNQDLPRGDQSTLSVAAGATLAR
jgi:hypothetical protein